ncbi:3 beta-hydroxysteroid dehydrogenase/Delta 5--_4-isomerase [bacterium BMS3Abin07]|nr:3 beta-hydroxysteroid dehydrogenase/Delta 5-->4-isomerase [bacterium BMS3Abin07]GBE32986.1 3 beta-hydroxysteroid dehydrogenase/Delta 5-->4-isomerase [bacterium BMS3Bbin05]HDL19661.1 NAD-dependent epimerase/dehydratase family protein [Nitrospirota bacterium]HDO21316.1 NAD-dependent epimerase/dehydratase family protein [Nitrospirota bacterium]
MDIRASHNVLVTGGTGFIGSHLVESLISDGYPVTCLVRDTGNLRWLKGLSVRLIEGDCTEPETLPPAVKDASTVFHLAGLTKARHITDYYRVNHIGTRNILRACIRHNPGLRKFIYLSSLAAAGPSNNGTPVRDTDTPHPVSDYGRSKLMAEEEILNLKDQCPTVIFRPSAVYGPRDRDMYELFRWAARGVTLEIMGGERFIAPCYVGDLITVLLLALKKHVPSGSIYFVSEDRYYSWSEFRQLMLLTGQVTARNIRIPYAIAYLIGLFSEFVGLVTGKPTITNRQKVREAIQKYWIGDIGKIKDDLGFRPVYPLKYGLEKTWKWYRENGWI